MNKSKHEKNQVVLLISALVLALAIIITAAYFIAKAIEGNDSMQSNNDIYLHKNTSQEDDSELLEEDSKYVIEDSSIVEEDKPDEGEATQPVELSIAQDYINYNTTDLITEFNDEYETLGYLEGGYFIYNFDVIPNLYFSVANDGNGKLINDELQAIIVRENGYIYDKVMVGMTYDELKLLCGNTMTITMGDETTCQEVVIETTQITAYVQFDIETNCSKTATVKFK